MSFVIAGIGALGLLLMYDGLTGRDRRGPSSIGRRWSGLVAEAGLPETWLRRAAWISTLSAGLTFAVVAGVTSSAVFGAIFGVPASALPFNFLAGRRSRRRKRFREAWPDAIESLISSVRAGTFLPEACVLLAERGPEELRDGWRAFTATYRSSGSFEIGLRRLRDEMADPTADRVVAALSIAYEVGGTELVRVLRALGDFVRDDLRARKEVEARWSWTVTAARVAAAAPWIVLLLMATRPEAARAYDSAAGVVVIAAGVVTTVAGYRLMLRAGRLPEDRRLQS